MSVSTHKDLSEFILDLTLLDRHLTPGQTNSDSNDIDISNDKDDGLTYMCRLELKKYSIQINQDEIMKLCRSFFESSKNDSDEDDDEDDENQFDDEDEEYEDEDDEEDENYDDEDDDDEYCVEHDERFHHEICCPNHVLKLKGEEGNKIDFNQLVSTMTNIQQNNSAQRKKEKRKLKKKLKKLEKNSDQLSTTMSTTSTNTTSSINVNEIINEKNKDLKLIRKKLNKEAREQAEKELEKQLQKINSTKKTSCSHTNNNNNNTQQHQQQTKQTQQKNNKKKNKKNKNNKSQQQVPNVVNNKKVDQDKPKEDKQLAEVVEQPKMTKTFGDLDDFDDVNTSNDKKLNDLDDFETTIQTQSKLNSLDDFGSKSKIEKLNVLDDFNDEPKTYLHTQNIIVPKEKLQRVLGVNNSNLTLIEKITNANLEMDKTTIIFVRGDSTESVEFALELIHTLINDPQADLSYLLPNEPVKKIEVNPVRQVETKIVKPQVKTKPVKSSVVKPQKVVQTVVETSKPRNFAEAVAKKPVPVKMINSTTQTGPGILAVSNTNRPVSIVPPLKNEKVEEEKQLEALKIETSSCTQPNGPASIDEAKNLEPVFDVFSWSLNEQDLLDRLSPFLSSSNNNNNNNNVEIDTSNLACSNVTVSKPIGYERNGKLLQQSNNENKQFAFINPIVNQKKIEQQHQPVILKPQVNFNNNFPINLQNGNQWVYANNFYSQKSHQSIQQPTDLYNPFMNQNYMYHNNFGYMNNAFNGIGIQNTNQTLMPNTVGSLFAHQQYRF